MNLFRTQTPDSPKPKAPASPKSKLSPRRVFFRSASEPTAATGSPSGSPRASTSPSRPPPTSMSAPAPAAPTTAATSPPPPSTPRRRPPLGFADVANIFVKMRRASNKAKAKASTKPWHIHSSSGAEPQSHPGALESASELRQPLQHRDVFICHDAVNAGQLLRATRNVLVEEAEFVGANALVDEQWDCTICGPKHRRNGTFKVEILYSASATQSDRADPHRPVALDQIKGVPGLMTVTKRIP